jgi:hypothetical protein
MVMGSLRGILLSVALDDNVHITPEMLKEFMLQGLAARRQKKATAPGYSMDKKGTGGTKR